MTEYADLARVRAILDSTSEPDEATFDVLNVVVSRELERACHVTGFGDAGEETSVTIRLPGSWALGCVGSPYLALPSPLRSLTEVTIDGIVTSDVALVWVEPDGRAWGLEAIGAFAWEGEIVITGGWAVQPGGDLPGAPTLADVTEAASVVLAGYVRKDRAADGEVSGPEGLTFRPGNAWNDERVKRLLSHYAQTAFAPVVV